jgi:adenosine deaminase
MTTEAPGLDPLQTTMMPGRSQVVERMPKVDLHRHLEGSLRLDTLAEIVRAEGLELPLGVDSLSGKVRIQPHDPPTAEAFLAKFEPLRQFYRTREIIQRLTEEVVADAAADGIRYLELRFNPRALASARGFNLGEVMDWVCAAAREASRTAGILVRLIVSVNRHEPLEGARAAAQAAAERIDQGVVGLDLAGQEWQPATPFHEIFAASREAGLGVTVHAGEWAGADAVRQAMEEMGAQRVGHGVRVMDDPAVVAMARDRGLVFEVCLTSNVQSGVVSEIGAHPLSRMIDAGLRVTLNTDDPQVSGITLGGEYEAARRECGLSEQTLQGLVLTAAQGSFLPEREKKALEVSLAAELFGGAPDEGR